MRRLFYRYHDGQSKAHFLNATNGIGGGAKETPPPFWTSGLLGEYSIGLNSDSPER